MSTTDETVCQYCGKPYDEHGDEWWNAAGDDECKGLKSYYIGATTRAVEKPPRRIVEQPATTPVTVAAPAKPKERFKRVRG